MHVHILGICGTFMGGIAAIAKAAGHRVTGSDKNVYPPMSTQLESLGIELTSGFEAGQLMPRPDVVVVGNVMTRGVPVIEALLDSGIPYASGPEWLAREVLRDVHVLGVAGTHGKTTTSSMLAWILEHAGLNPGFLIGGVPGNFSVSARLGGRKFFVIEAMSTTRRSSTSAPSSFTTARERSSSTISSSTTPISTKIWRRSKSSSITWCARCLPRVAFSGTPATRT